MDFRPVKPDLVRFEMRKTEGVPAQLEEIKKPGTFGRFLSGMGRFFGAVSMPLTFIFPPAALAAAGMYGVGQIGDIVQQRAYSRAIEQQAIKQQTSQVVYPGLGATGEGSGMQRASGTARGVSNEEDRVMNVLFARDQALNAMAQEL